MFVHGSLAFEKGPEQTVKLTDSSTKTVTTINVGAENLTIFVGVNGPYWTDVDGDQDISWALPDGTTLTNANGTAKPTVTVNGVQYGDLNGNGKVDVGETASWTRTRSASRSTTPTSR